MTRGNSFAINNDVMTFYFQPELLELLPVRRCVLLPCPLIAALIFRRQTALTRRQTERYPVVTPTGWDRGSAVETPLALELLHACLCSWNFVRVVDHFCDLRYGEYKRQMCLVLLLLESENRRRRYRQNGHGYSPRGS